MIRWSCVRTSSLIGGRPTGLSSVERLALEDHLAACAPCREVARLADSLVRLANTTPARPGSPESTERVVTRALREAGAARPARPRFRLRPALIGAAALAATVAVALAAHELVTGRGQASRQANPEVRPPETIDQVVSGAIVAGGGEDRSGAEIGPGGAVASGAVVETREGAVLALAHARVELAAGTAVVWDPAATLVTLRSGAIEVSVDGAPGRRFRAATDRFVVEVLGTRFRVAPGGVLVREGSVRIRSPDGAILADWLGAGREWLVAAGAPDAPSAQPPAKPTAAEHLDRARSHLAARQVEAALRELDSARRADPDRSERADAALLAAEAALVDGRATEAVRLYLAAHELYDDLVAGESALFAAARLQARDGPRAAARRLLEQYLERYPDGHFGKEAAATLRDLDDREEADR